MSTSLFFLMTNNIYPPDHLLKKWEQLIIDEEQNVDVVLYEVFQAGADQELKACCEWLADGWGLPAASDNLCAVRRPKPPSLKEQALQALNRFTATEGHEGCADEEVADDYCLIRRAIESLPDYSTLPATMTDYKQLCAELLDALESYMDWSNAEELKSRARTALAEPEPEGPTDEELFATAEVYTEDNGLIGLYNSPDFARAVLARWGNHPGSPDSSTQSS
jgi:hypothetical protein